MGPSAYHAKLSKDQLVEDREGVKVIFAGVNVFHVRVGEAEKPFSTRGAKAAWERAEAERAKLNPEYLAIPYEKPEQPAAPIPAETEGEQLAETPVAPADNVENTDDEGEGGDAVATQDVSAKHVSLAIGSLPIVMMSVKDVRAMLGDYQGRLPEFIGNPTYRRLTERVRASDGCCAPVFFISDDEREEVQFFAGLETLGAAIHLGMKRIAVVFVPPEAVKEGQGPIVAMLNEANAASADSDDEMVYRAYN